MSDDLKPCPFCGGEANAWEYEDEQDVLDPTSLGWIGTRCITWHCVGCESCEISISRLSKDDAEAAWNARAERTCRMNHVLLYDEMAVDGIECDECFYIEVHSLDDPLPDCCPGCGAKVVG